MSTKYLRLEVDLLLDTSPLTHQVHYLKRGENEVAYDFNRYREYPLTYWKSILVINPNKEGETIEIRFHDPGEPGDSLYEEKIDLLNNKPVSYTKRRTVYGLDKMPHSESWCCKFTLVDLSDTSIINEAISSLANGGLYNETPGEGEYIEGLYETFNLRYSVEEAMDEAHKKRFEYMKQAASKGFLPAKEEIEK